MRMCFQLTGTTIPTATSVGLGGIKCIFMNTERETINKQKMNWFAIYGFPPGVLRWQDQFWIKKCYDKARKEAKQKVLKQQHTLLWFALACKRHTELPCLHVFRDKKTDSKKDSTQKKRVSDMKGMKMLVLFWICTQLCPCKASRLQGGICVLCADLDSRTGSKQSLYVVSYHVALFICACIFQ